MITFGQDFRADSKFEGLRTIVGTLHGFACTVFETFKNVCYTHPLCTGQRATKLPVLLQSYLLQVMYTKFQYQTVSCIPAIGYVPNISIPDIDSS